MNSPHSTAKKLLGTLAILNALLTMPLASGQSDTTPPAQPAKARKSRGQPDAPPSAGENPATGKAPSKAQAAGMTKREYKKQKRERQQRDMLQRVERRAQGVPATNPTPPAPTIPNPYQFAEDFDSGVNWEQKDNRTGKSTADYGYSSTNHLASAGCAAGEIGGSVSDSAISWFADNIALGPALLDVDSPLSASGWCMFTAMQGNASVGWFNSETYAAPDVAPDTFIGWRQDGASICAALGHTGSSFLNGPPLAVPNGKPFQWTLSYAPTGGTNACGQVILTVVGSSSTLSLSKEQKDALAANKFNRFGIVTAKTGSETSTFWLDNLTYTRISGFPVPHAEATAHTRTAFFDTDPTDSTFFGVNNLSPHQPETVTQDYGYRPTGGRSGGCVGGRFTQAIGTSYYGYDYGGKMLHFTDKLRSEGWFQVPSYEGRCFHFGWASKTAKSWHEPSTLGLKISSINNKREGHFLNVSAEGTLKNNEGHGGAGWGTVLTIPAGPLYHGIRSSRRIRPRSIRRPDRRHVQGFLFR